MIKVCMILEKEWLLANNWGGASAPPPQAPGWYGPGLGVVLGYYVNELQKNAKQLVTRIFHSGHSTRARTWLGLDMVNRQTP
jgi:hypothetical protein